MDVSQIEKQVERHTILANQKVQFNQNKDRFKRSLALNKFMINTCEFHILKNLDQHETRVKDKVNIFYKTIETCILDKNEEFNLKVDYHDNNPNFKGKFKI